jgi:hypothetical protein
MWVLFMVPCPTPDGQTAEDLYRKRIDWISPEMQASARELGCRFHRAWHAEDRSLDPPELRYGAMPFRNAVSACIEWLWINEP